MALAALAATFWLLVATARLVLDPPAAHLAPVPVPAPLAPPRPSRSKVSSDDCCPCRLGDISRPVRAGDGGDRNPLSRAAILKGLDAVEPLVHACYRRFHVPGTAMVNVAIANSGRVSSAQVSGKFAGTPTGACVEAAVKTARFPPSDGFVTPWRLQLR